MHGAVPPEKYGNNGKSIECNYWPRICFNVLPASRVDSPFRGLPYQIKYSMKQSITDKFANDAIAAPAAVTGGCGKGGKGGKSGGKSKSRGKGRSGSGKSGSGKSGSGKSGSGCGGVVGDQFN